MADIQTTRRLPSTKTVFGDNRGSAIFAASNCLRLAAAPIFGIMALLTWIHGGSMPDMLCSATHDVTLLSGMIPMYVLMSIFHSPPWLKLISRQ
jgi:hypothetical protein